MVGAAGEGLWLQLQRGQGTWGRGHKARVMTSLESPLLWESWLPGGLAGCGGAPGLGRALFRAATKGGHIALAGELDRVWLLPVSCSQDLRIRLRSEPRGLCGQAWDRQGCCNPLSVEETGQDTDSSQPGPQKCSKAGQLSLRTLGRGDRAGQL